MTFHRRHHEHTHNDERHAHSCFSRLGFWHRWVLANSLLGGLLALVWLILRSGTKPSRFAYPCQQAAVSAATLAFGAPVVATIIAARRGLAATLRKPAGIVTAALGLAATIGLWAALSRADEYTGPTPDPARGYRAELFHVTRCPRDPVGDSFIGLDRLIRLMGRGGLRFYESPTQTLVAGPDGIIAADDVVVIKINYQWPERGGTNTDVLRGLIRNIVDHPDTFTGEIVVCENAQFNPIDGFDRLENNAQDHTLSPHDVVVGFQTLGYTVSHCDWTILRYTSVDEYSEGDIASGYVIYPYDSDLHGRISYPKFETDEGTLISLRDGIWDADSETYDRERLKIVNVPVLKSHHATYGVTACVKHYMGVVTRELSTSSHSAIAYGILGAVMGECQPPDLNILDSIWINANPYDGPWTEYENATRRDELIASVDPVATDIWAAKNILIPAFVSSGYTPPWPYPSADPDNPDSSFRNYLDNSMNYLLAAGYEVTNDLDQIDALTWNGMDMQGDFDENGSVDLTDYSHFADCLSGPGALPAPGEPATAGECLWFFDFDDDADVDLSDFALFTARLALDE